MFPMVSGKRSPEISSPGKKSPGKWSLEKCPPKIVRQKTARIFERLFIIFIDWFHYTHKKMFDVYLTILHAPNCRTLKESRKICCRVLGFYRLITFHTLTPRCSTLAPRFCRGPFFGDFFPGTIFPGTFFPRDHFSEDFLSRDFDPGDHFFQDSFSIPHNEINITVPSKIV